MAPTLLIAAVVGLALIFGAPGQANAGGITFGFQFDDSGGGGGPEGTVSPPIVGTGTFTIATDPGIGIFTLSSLGSFSMSFTIAGGTATDANIASDPNQTLVDITGFAPGVERVYFSDTTGGGAFGPFNGSLDLTSSSLDLSFNPSDFGHNLYGSSTSDGVFDFGNYLALSVPEPSGIVQLGLGASCLAVFIAHRRKRKTAAA